LLHEGHDDIAHLHFEASPRLLQSPARNHKGSAVRERPTIAEQRLRELQGQNSTEIRIEKEEVIVAGRPGAGEIDEYVCAGLQFLRVVDLRGVGQLSEGRGP
jgi:hypothetical protein